jgi:alpha-L-fucosidase
LSEHKVPEWFHDAKLGIFIHWGLYSIPAFATTGINIAENISKHGWEEHYKNNPYAEWYLNSLKIEGSPTQIYHEKTYGKEFSYDSFVPMFNNAIKRWNADEMVDLFKKAGARYVVLVTRHCDGFLLWPSKYPNPNKKNYIADRDVVGELSNAVTKKRMKFGVYYCSAWEWTFNPKPIKDLSTFFESYSNPPEYTEYVNNHWYELIDRYEPKILWSDMGYPPGSNVNELFAYFYNKFPDGIVNNRWDYHFSKEKKVEKNHFDFQTPEYITLRSINKVKWECTRGIGNSFGYNQFETEQDYLTSEELIRIFIDIVSKNGNLLLNVGPMADGTIPEIQKKRLIDLGRWLDVNGEAIFGTRPWKKAKSKTLDGIEVRFTQKKDILYVILLNKPKGGEIIIKSLNIDESSTIKFLQQNRCLNWKQEQKNVKIEIFENIEYSPAYVFKIETKKSSNN